MTSRTQWEHRRDALLDNMQDKSAIYGNFATTHTLQALVLRLRTFTEKQFNFFFWNVPLGNFEAIPDYPADYVYAIPLDQASYDLEVIERAASQRLYGTASMIQCLDEADCLAHRVLQQAAAYLPPDPEIPDRVSVRAVTYFQKLVSVRVIPYAPVTLIGIPYFAANDQSDRFDLLAIPHEVGHYVFWHGKDPATQRPLHEVLQENAKLALQPFISTDNAEFPAWCYVWLEEAFADIFGALVAGPVALLALRDILHRRSWFDFVFNDNDHPAAVLRPYAVCKALRFYGQADTPRANWQVWAELFVDDWWLHRLTRKSAETIRLGCGREIPVVAAVYSSTTILDAAQPGVRARPVDALVKVILAALSRLTMDDWSGGFVPDLSQLNTPGVEAAEVYEQNLQGLLAAFNQYFTNTLKGQLQPPEVLRDQNFDWVSYVTDVYKPAGDLKTIANQMSSANAPTSPRDLNIPREEWKPIFSSQGWTLEPTDYNWPKP